MDGSQKQALSKNSDDDELSGITGSEDDNVNRSSTSFDTSVSMDGTFSQLNVDFDGVTTATSTPRNVGETTQESENDTSGVSIV